MKGMRFKHLLILCCLGCGALSVPACNEVDNLQKDADALAERVSALEESVNQMNATIEGLQRLSSNLAIVGVTEEDGAWKVEFSDGTSSKFVKAQSVNALFPLVKIDNDKCWSYSVDGGKTYTTMKDSEGNAVKAYPVNADGEEIKSPKLRISADGCWQVSYDGGKTYTNLKQDGKDVSALGGEGASSVFSDVKYDTTNQQLSVTLTATGETISFPVINTFYLKLKDAEGEQAFQLGETKTYEVEQSEVQEATVQAPTGWKVVLSETELSVTAPSKVNVDKEEAAINIIITSPKNYIRVVTLNASVSPYDASSCQAWKNFVLNNSDNVLLDFSYAGYKHGEVAPPDVNTLGYTVYNVTDYGAVANDGKSDRAAIIKILEAMGATKGADSDADRYYMTKPANAIIYFPEGEFILQGSEDESNKTIRISMSNLVLKGAGSDKTTIKMDKANEPTDETKLYSCPTMLELKHNTGLSKITDVTADAAKGTFAVTVSSTAGISVGDWVCLQLNNSDSELIKQELSPYTVTSLMTNIKQGVTVYDYHQVKSISGNVVTFEEPLMHAVEAKWNWTIMKYPHYENVGVEDITFKGNAKADFAHHASAADDGAYKPIDMIRLTNSWMRRVNFESVSECSSIVNSANVSVYDVHIGGNRGHAAIRSQASSRVFIGKVVDESNGYEAITSSGEIGSELITGAGQYHACGVSKQSIGAVIWNVTWGKDGCFESHATQPRATLIDRCQGAFIPWRQGGDKYQMPNHLDDLVIWNMNATKVGYDSAWGGKFLWWDSSSDWWKLLPPTVVGFHGQSIVFDESQMKLNESQGTAVEPYSLYEAQLKKRLGAVPAWLNSLK